MNINKNECLAAGLDIKKIESLVRRLDRLGKDMNALGVYVFGCGEGTLRFNDCQDKGDLILADFRGHFDGGHGGEEDYGDNLIRGE